MLRVHHRQVRRLHLEAQRFVEFFGDGLIGGDLASEEHGQVKPLGLRLQSRGVADHLIKLHSTRLVVRSLFAAARKRLLYVIQGLELPRQRVVGLGLNETELRENGQLDAWVAHDVNRDPRLPFDDDAFDAVVMAVSVQYLTSPIEVFREVRRVLRPGGPFVVSYSNRLFPEKAVAIWYSSTDEERARLITAYFHYAGGWEAPTAQDRSPRPGLASDPLFAVWARKAPGEAAG